MLQALKKYLDLSLYGAGQAKTWNDLETEIRSGECLIEWQADRPIRLVKIACIEVLSHKGERLIEAYQELADGRIRQRRLTELAEKFKPHESPLEVARRALAEELGIHEHLAIETLGEAIDERESLSYPGLLSRYYKFLFRVVLPKSLYKPEYVEIQPNKKVVFHWTSCTDLNLL